MYVLHHLKIFFYYVCQVLFATDNIMVIDLHCICYCIVTSGTGFSDVVVKSVHVGNSNKMCNDRGLE